MLAFQSEVRVHTYSSFARSPATSYFLLTNQKACYYYSTGRLISCYNRNKLVDGCVNQHHGQNRGCHKGKLLEQRCNKSCVSYSTFRYHWRSWRRMQGDNDCCNYTTGEPRGCPKWLNTNTIYICWITDIISREAYFIGITHYFPKWTNEWKMNWVAAYSPVGTPGCSRTIAR